LRPKGQKAKQMFFAITYMVCCFVGKDYLHDHLPQHLATKPTKYCPFRYELPIPVALERKLLILVIAN